MIWEVRVRAAVAAVVCCLLPLVLCQDATDIYRGCYYDGGDEATRVMTDLISCAAVEAVCQDSCGPLERYCESDAGMTVDVCRTLCRDRNFQYYGLEGGNQCFCGGSFSDPFAIGVPPADASVNCTDPCTGDSSKTCGGEFRLEVYEFQDPVVDPGCFFPRSVPYAIVIDVGVGIGETLTFTCEPGYELVGESTLTCISNRTWSSNAVTICNYTGVIPATTTRPAPTTQPAITTDKTRTTGKPPTTISESTRPDVTPTESKTILTTAQAQTTKTTDKPIPTTKAQTSITDLMPYIIGGSAALLLLLVICIVAIFVCTARKRSGNAKQNISLKPDDLAPVTLLNSGFSPDPEADMPDVRLDSETCPPIVENEYVNQNGASHEMSIFKTRETGASKGDDKFWEDQDGYAEMKPLSPLYYPPNPIYESADAGRAQDADRSSSEGDKASTVSDNVYDRVDGGKKWDSKENLISDDGDSIFTDPERTMATKL